MKKKLYYTIEKEIEEDYLTGNKIITVYEIIDNQPKQFASIDTTLEADSRKEILAYLDDNGFGDDEFDLIFL